MITQDNVIEWIFEKMFSQLTADGRELEMSSFELVKKKTFFNVDLYVIINKLTTRSVESIKNYLTDKDFINRFLFNKLPGEKKRINPWILLGDLNMIKQLVNQGYRINLQTVVLTVLNNQLEIFDYLMNKFPLIKLTTEMLTYAAENGFDQMYFKIRNLDIYPNISVLKRATIGSSIGIIKDIIENISLDKQSLENAFQTNHTEIITYLITEAKESGLKISPNMATYPVLNCNWDVLEFMEGLNLIE